ncbi:MAG: EamA family transporter, partial [Cyanobacteria bacterium J06643_4]
MVRIYLKLVATALIWGGTFIAGRIAVQTIGPFSVAFLRFAIASLS